MVSAALFLQHKISRKESFLGSETAGGYVGSYIGMFASGNGTEYAEYAAFDWFAYEGLDEET